MADTLPGCIGYYGFPLPPNVCEKCEVSRVCKKKTRMRKYLKDYRKKNKDKIREARRRYYINNKERILEKNRRWRRENKEKVREQNRRWKEKNRNKARLINRISAFLNGKTYTNKKGGLSYTAGFLDGQGICIICGELNPFALEEHHMFKNDKNSLVLTLCGSCHNILHRFPTMLEERFGW
jgi:hypothetical protein